MTAAINNEATRLHRIRPYRESNPDIVRINLYGPHMEECERIGMLNWQFLSLLVTGGTKVSTLNSTGTKKVGTDLLFENIIGIEEKKTLLGTAYTTTLTP